MQFRIDELKVYNGSRNAQSAMRIDKVASSAIDLSRQGFLTGQEGNDDFRTVPYDSPSNLASGATVTASATYPHFAHDPSLVTDGIYGNGSAFVANFGGSDLVLDLGRPVTFDRLHFGQDRLSRFNDMKVDDFTIEVSNDGTSFETIYDSSHVIHGTIAPYASKLNDTFAAQFDPVTARHIRFYSSQRYRIDELEVYLGAGNGDSGQGLREVIPTGLIPGSEGYSPLTPGVAAFSTIRYRNRDNLALGASVTATSPLGDPRHGANLLTDGAYGNGSAFVSGYSGSQVEFDLGQQKSFDRIVLGQDRKGGINSRRLDNLLIETSSDGIHFDTVFDTTSMPVSDSRLRSAVAGSSFEVKFPLTDGRFVRLTSTGGSFRLDEVEIYRGDRHDQAGLPGTNRSAIFKLPFESDHAGRFFDPDGYRIADGTFNRVDGPFGRAVQFPAGQFTQLPATPRSNRIGRDDGDYSIAFWYRPDSQPSPHWQRILHKPGSTTDRAPAVFIVPGTQKLHMPIQLEGTWTAVTTLTEFTVGQWSHVTIVKQGREFSVHVNGRHEATQGLSGPSVGTDGPFTFGDATATFSVDEFVVVDRAMDAAEIAYYADHGLSPGGTFEEDEVFYLRNEDITGFPGSGNHQYMTITSLPEHGTLHDYFGPIEVGKTFNVAALDVARLRYVPLPGRQGTGTHQFGYSLSDHPAGPVYATNHSNHQFRFGVEDLPTAATMSLNITNAAGEAISAASVGEQIVVATYAQTDLPVEIWGAHIDLAYNREVLRPIGRPYSRPPYTLLNGSGYVRRDRIRAFGNSSQYSDAAAAEIAAMRFEVVAAGDPGLKIEIPDEGPFGYQKIDRLLLQDPSRGTLTSYTDGSVDFIQPIFSINAPATGMAPPPTASGIATTNSGQSSTLNFSPMMASTGEGWQFSDSTDADGIDTTPEAASEANRLFRTTPIGLDFDSSEIPTTDDAYLRLEFYGEESESGAAVPWLYFTGVDRELYSVDYEIDTPKLASRYEISTTEFLIQPGFSFETDSPGRNVKIVAASVDQREALDLKRLQVQIVYFDPSGSIDAGNGQRFSITPPDDSSDASDVKTISLLDNEEPFELTGATSAIEATSTTSATKGTLTFQTSGSGQPIPQGLVINSPHYSWDSKARNYFDKRIRFIIEVPQANGQPGVVADGYADPLADFTLSRRLAGFKNATGQPLADPAAAVAVIDPDDSKPTDQTLPPPVPLQIETLSLAEVPGGQANRLYYVVSDLTPNDDWIKVGGNPDTGIWDRFELVVNPNVDSLDEGIESFTIHAEGEVPLDYSIASISGQTLLTNYIHLGSETLEIVDSPDQTVDDDDDNVTNQTPSGDGELQPDGVCDCPCTVCSGDVPIRLMDAAVNLRPLGPGGGSPVAAKGPSFHSPGNLSSQQTFALAMPFDNITGAAGEVPDRINLTASVATTWTNPGQPAVTEPVTDRLTLQLPSNHKVLGQSGSIAVRLPASLPAGTPTGFYRVQTQSVARTGDATSAVWRASAPMLVNDLTTNYDLAPGWAMPFDYKLVIGTIGGGNPNVLQDYGAALFRPNQSASYFPGQQGGFGEAVDTFETVQSAGIGFRVTGPDGSVMEFSGTGGSTEINGRQTIHRVTAMVDANGNRTAYGYQNGRIKSVTDPMGRKTRYDWADLVHGQRLIVTDHHNRTATYLYSAIGSTPSVAIQYSGGDGPAMIERFDYDPLRPGEVISHTRTAVGGGSQTTSVQYRGYGPGGVIRRVGSLTQPGGETFTLQTPGFDDALPDQNGRWFNQNQWNQPPVGSSGVAGPWQGWRLNQLTTSFWAEGWTVNPTNPADSAGAVAVAEQLQRLPRRGLADFENYASYVISSQNNATNPRRFEVTLDRRGRLLASQNPNSGVTRHLRTTEPIGPDSGLLKRDRGQIEQTTGPDPDRRGGFNGPLTAPVSRYRYDDGTPFVQSIDLPTLSGPGQTNHQMTRNSYVAGRPTSLSDELGNHTLIATDSNGNPVEITRRADGQWVPIIDDNRITSWTNPSERFDVTGENPTLVSANDALQIINELNSRTHSTEPNGEFQTPQRPAGAEFYDVNADGRVTALDALRIINELNRREALGSQRIAVNNAEDAYEQTELIYVGSPRYAQMLASLVAGNPRIVAETISPAFQQTNLLGARITSTGRGADDPAENADDGDLVEFFVYHLDDANRGDHGQLRATVTANLLPDATVPNFVNAAVTTYTYDSNGFVQSIADPLGRTTHFEHDALGRVTQMTTPPVGVFELGGAANNQSIGSTITDYRYDAFGNLFQTVVTGSTLDLNTVNDAAGTFHTPQIIRQSRVTTYRYDSANRLVGIIEPLPTTSLSNEENAVVDPAAEQPRISDGNTLDLTTIQHAGRRPITQYVHDDLGQRIQMIRTVADGIGPSTTAVTDYQYDRLGRLISVQQPEIEVLVNNILVLQRPTTTYEHYDSGPLHAVIDPSGLRTETIYDIWGRPLQQSTGALTSKSHRITHQYLSAQVGADLAAGTANNVGWQTTTLVFGNSKLLSGSRILNDRDGRTRTEQTLLQDLDGNNQWDDIDQTATRSMSYFSDGQLATATDARGFVTDFGYDYLGRRDVTMLPPIEVVRFDGNSVTTTEATRPTTRSVFDGAGQMISQLDADGRSTTFRHDDWGNVTDVVRQGDIIRNGYDYDGFGQLIRRVNGSVNFVPSSYAAATSNLNIDLQMNVYDALGRLEGSLEGFTGLSVYGYDRGSRVTSFADPAGNITTFGFDDDDRKIRRTRTIPNPANPAVTINVNDRYAYDAIGNLAAQNDAAGRLIRYKHNPRLSPKQVFRVQQPDQNQ